MASILSYTKARLDAMFADKVTIPANGSDGQALVRLNGVVVWGTVATGGAGGTATTNAGDLTTGTLSINRIADSSIPEDKLFTQTMMTSGERSKLSGIASGATANRTDSDTDTAIATRASAAGSLRVALWNGTVYQVAGTTVTSANRPANSYIEFQGGPDPAGISPSLGVVNGDSWKSAA